MSDSDFSKTLAKLFKRPPKPPHNGGNNDDNNNGDSGNGGSGGNEPSSSLILTDQDLLVLDQITQETVTSARSVERTAPLFNGAILDGQMCQGGNNGQILTVNRLDDISETTRGTLRWALDQDGPKIIKFAVQGIIDLKKSLVVRKGRVTIDGSEKTVVISGAGVTFRETHDIYIKNMRFRPGSHYSLANGKSYDALTIMQCLYVYLDHVSASWGTDETLSVNKSGFVTIDSAMIAGPLSDPKLHVENGVEISHPYGSLITGHKISVVNSLWAFYSIRGPQTDIDAGSVKLFANNFSFCYTGSGCRIELDDNSVGTLALINNVYKQPSDLQNKPMIEFVNVPPDANTIKPNQIIYIGPKDESRNPFDRPAFSGSDSSSPSTERINAVKKLKIISPTSPTNYPVHYKDFILNGGKTKVVDLVIKVLQNAGATLPERDPVDTWFIDAIKANKNVILRRESDMGGFSLYPFWLRRPV